MAKRSKWIKWRRKLLKKCRTLIRKHENLGFLPQNVYEVTQQNWRMFFDDNMSVDEAINEELEEAMRLS